jgi:hypothetical protein
MIALAKVRIPCHDEAFNPVHDCTRHGQPQLQTSLGTEPVMSRVSPGASLKVARCKQLLAASSVAVIRWHAKKQQGEQVLSMPCSPASPLVYPPKECAEIAG